MGQKFFSPIKVVEKSDRPVVCEGDLMEVSPRSTEIRESRNMSGRPVNGHVDGGEAQSAIDERNGLMFHGYSLPEEIVVLVLSFLDSSTLLKCRAVCHVWKSAIDTEVWRLCLNKELYRSLRATKKDIPWHAYYMLVKHKNPFGRNLLKNHCGQEGLQHWSLQSNGGDHWQIEDPPFGADALPTVDELNDVTSCFATSYYSCSKQQVIQLSKEGFVPEIIDNLQPRIQVSEWYAGRFDCGCIYELQVELLDEKEKQIVDFNIRRIVTQWEGSAWHKVSHVFHDYGPGVRYVKFYHGGSDTQFWAGHYGSKMSGGCVKVLVPVSRP